MGVEGLERFLRGEPLRRVHECVFGVLALESEPVGPSLWAGAARNEGGGARTHDLRIKSPPRGSAAGSGREQITAFSLEIRQ